MNNVFGPLTKVGCAIEFEKDANPDDGSLSQVAQALDQIVMLLGQAHNAISYHRRGNILTTLIDTSPRVKEILKNQSKDLNTPSNKFLFGEDFESKLIKDTKAIKKSESVFTGVKPSASSSFKPRFPPIGSKRPFPGGPLSAGRGRGHAPTRPGFSFRGKKISLSRNFSMSYITKVKPHSSKKVANPKTVSSLCTPSCTGDVSSRVDCKPTKGRSYKILPVEQRLSSLVY